MGSRPRIGVTAPAQGGYGSWLFTRLILGFYGAKAVKLTTKRKVDLHALHGFVIAGGADVDPRLYGKELKQEWEAERKRVFFLKSWLLLPLVFLVRVFSSRTHSKDADNARDTLELAVIAHAFEKNLPLLGICRGMQLMNIYHKGTLHQEIKDFYTESPHLTTLLPRKTIHIALHSKLYEILGHQRYRVNSLHHQSIDLLGEKLHKVAWESNGIIQAIEAPAHPFFVGIQWHPEYLLQFRPQRAFFFHLVAAAKSQKVTP
ncbi:MAG: gamma-glutamyl-gamma-aminobutyrate hydrolase family protein [Campylobacterales bacterium]|nr:gamma-glutamyl-gamma-aminobutyrate hydrolase family protein [Campylobacterales bacterium]